MGDSEKEEKWGFAIDITYACEHKCRHCCVEASPQGASMGFLTIRDIIRQLNGMKRPYGVSLTGGDIFRYRDKGKNLLDIVNLLVKSPGAREYWRGLQLFFAPFNSNKYEEPIPIQMLELLSPFIQKGFGDITTSYTLYSKDIDKRLLHTLPILFQWTNRIKMVVTIDKNNDLETGQRLSHALKYQGFLPDQRFGRLAETAHWEPPVSFSRATSGPSQTIIISANPTSPVGRAKKWNGLYDFVGKTDCPRRIEKNSPKIAYITLKGNVLPCYSTFPNLSPLGNIFKEPLKVILSRWDSYREQLEIHFQERYSPIYRDFCTWCAKTFKFKV